MNKKLILMNSWHRLLERFGMSDTFGRDRSASVPRDPTGFSIALLALCAKMAKASGRITLAKVRCVRSIISIAPEDELAAGRVFDLCGRDPSGFETYARKIHKAIGTGSGADDLREDVVEAMLLLAMADGSYHPGEERIFTEISSILEIDQNRKRRVEARHLPDAWDPHMVLGVSQDASREELKHAWRRLVKKEHPDAVQARGSPKEMIRLAEERMVRINLAYAQVVRQAVPQFS